MTCLNAPYCEHRSECSPMVCDSFVPTVADDKTQEEPE